MRRPPLGVLLFGAVGTVVLTTVGVATAVAVVVAPGLFHQHMAEAGAGLGSAGVMHAEEAFRSAGGIALGWALATAVLASLVVSAGLARRVARAMHPLAAAASDVAEGRYGVTVPAPGLGAEVDGVARAFNHMAARLREVEETRRRLLADLAHEMRTPVATLGAYLEAVEDGVTELDPDTVTMLQAQTGRLARLAQDVADVSRAEEGAGLLRRVPARVDDLVGTALAAVADRAAEQRIALHADVTPGLPAVLVDVDRLGQVLGNLLDNALRHTPPGGRVDVRADRFPGARVRLQVTDTGEGVAADHLPHLFERFYRADPARSRAHGGSGIGLAIVKALVEAHGGAVSAASAGPGHGTTVTVLLPDGP